MSSFGDRLKEVRGELTQAEFADILGIPQVTLGNYERGRNEPRFEFIEKVCSRFEINVEWLLFGTGNRRGGPAGTAKPTCDVDLIMIPMVEARLSAGPGSLETSGECERSYAFRSDFLHRKGNPDDMVLMRVEGDSMQPEIMHNDVVLIDRSKTQIRLGRIFAVGFEEAIYLKRIDMLPGKIVLKSANPAYPPVELDIREQQGDSFRVIGQVLWSGREYV
ncbi:S24 family peptidase [uncultured Desulfovibrio sp.]|uniref:XRE family transcriptional regulator n=1 Tax=uncultured Desulfovibrio sp. TaxID=167968 RepID=UPI0026286DFB|nr:S24 family peptidase [uncultured Desulfovibrio sp.]